LAEFDKHRPQIVIESPGFHFRLRTLLDSEIGAQKQPADHGAGGPADHFGRLCPPAAVSIKAAECTIEKQASDTLFS
jgi:hypothetical protein